MSRLNIRSYDAGSIITVKVVPGSSRTSLAGILGTMLKVKVSSAPEKGKANDCLIGFLAKLLGVKKKDISIISGHSRSVKQVQVAGVFAETIESVLSGDKA